MRHGVLLARGTRVQRLETGRKMGKTALLNGLEATPRRLGAEELRQVCNGGGL
jgi:hypothetical protein